MSTNLSHKWQAFMAAVEFQYYEEIKEVLLSYEVDRWIIAKETSSTSHKETNGEHLHFMCLMSDQDYNRFAKRIFIDRFKLRGRAIKDHPRQYGKVKNIENVSRMQSYTLKDGNFQTNMSEKEIQVLCDASFKKNEDRNFNDRLYDWLKENYEHGSNGIVHFILLFYVQFGQGRDPSRNAIERHARVFFMYHCDTVPYEERMQYIKLFTDRC